MRPAFVPAVVDQLSEAIPELWNLRTAAVRSVRYGLADLAELDDRMEAYLDALRAGGPGARDRCESGLALDSSGEMFVATLFALEARDEAKINKLCAVAEAIAEARAGLHAAFGWVSARVLYGTVKALLASPLPFLHLVGLTACVAHRVHPGNALVEGLTAPESFLRSAAARLVGELGDIDAANLVFDAKGEEGSEFWGAWSAVLLGERQRAFEFLKISSQRSGPHRESALALVLRAASLAEAHETLRALATDPADLRELVQSAGIVGDPSYVSWLIKQMSLSPLARLAGESFSLITGSDLAKVHLDATRPEGLESGPCEDLDADPTIDADADLPWPEPKAIEAWWHAQKHRFQPGVRHFAGQPISIGHCQKVLREGNQRQRNAAALFLSLLQPGVGLFPTSAPAWRQKRWLDKMT